jgi:hypothetical protein
MGMIAARLQDVQLKIRQKRFNHGYLLRNIKIAGPDVDHVSLEPAQILAVEARPAGNRLPVANSLNA